MVIGSVKRKKNTPPSIRKKGSSYILRKTVPTPGVGGLGSDEKRKETEREKIKRGKEKRRRHIPH